MDSPFMNPMYMNESSAAVTCSPLPGRPEYVINVIRTDNPQEVIQAVEKVWRSLAPGQPFQYSFLDEDFGRMYHSEERLGKIFTVFATLAIAIACLGLFALTAFTAEQRSREIGIRKVLGASVNSILLLLSRDFGRLIIIAFIISTPLAWCAVNWWLETYTYRAVTGLLHISWQEPRCSS